MIHVEALPCGNVPILHAMKFGTSKYCEVCMHYQNACIHPVVGKPKVLFSNMLCSYLSNHTGI